MAESLLREMGTELDLPYVLFGYSMGALLAYELVVRLQLARLRTPELLCVAACRPPSSFVGRTWSQLTDNELVDYLLGLDQSVPGDLWNADQVRRKLPLLRADLLACECYVPSADAPLQCPITTYCGSADSLAMPDEVLGWQRHTTRSSIRHVLAGGHFFLMSHERSRLARILGRELSSITGQTS